MEAIELGGINSITFPLIYVISEQEVGVVAPMVLSYLGRKQVIDLLI